MTILGGALAELPPPEELNLLRGLPTGASLADYQALPPGHTARLLTQLAKERRLLEAGRRFTSLIEARRGAGAVPPCRAPDPAPGPP